ncbi:MAG: HPF/RaiA family ribosome-associated protein [Cyclobacteriaceae bacterium]|nr:HPF/RaiA family ribosome-associated protein [Cyclobacteriaceae bacterium]
MKIEVNTDRHIEGSERLIAYCTETLEAEFDRFSDYITRMDVHFSDENGAKGGDDDKRCLIEAKLKGLSPVTTTNHASNLDDAFSGAIDKMSSVLDSTLSKLRGH